MTESISQPPYTFPLPQGLPEDHRPHTESTTTILVPNENIAFLNPVQQYNRDLSVACIRAWNDIRKEESEARWRLRKERGKGKPSKDRRKKVEGETDSLERPLESKTSGEQSAAGPSTERKFRANPITILEALSATGLRSIRYAKEIPDVRLVLANDISRSACEAMRMNVAYNGVTEEPKPERKDHNTDSSLQSTVELAADAPGLSEATENIDSEEKALNESSTGEQEKLRYDAAGRREGCTGRVRVNEGDACTLMYQHRAPHARVDVVDLDPYGTAAPFIDAAIGCIADGGLLCVTCTDLAVLAGSNYPEKAYSNYGGVSVNAEYQHEVALRLVLFSLASTAARYGRQIIPLLSLSIDFYVRLFIRIESKPEQVKSLPSQTGIIYVCHYCQSPTLQPFGRVQERGGSAKNGQVLKNYKTAQGPTVNSSQCEECGSTLHIGGPMWLGPIHQPEFVSRVLKGIEGQQEDYGTWPRMNGMLRTARDELPDPFYFTNNKIHGLVHGPSAPMKQSVSALLNAGYKVSRSHAQQGSIKTNAPRSFIFDIVRESVKKNPVRMDKIAEGSPVRKLLAKPMIHTIDFTPHPDASKFEKGDSGEKIVRYQENPTANWGPGARAKTKSAPLASKRKADDSNVNGTHAVQEKKPRVADEDVDEEAALNA